MKHSNMRVFDEDVPSGRRLRQICHKRKQGKKVTLVSFSLTLPLLSLNDSPWVILTSTSVLFLVGLIRQTLLLSSFFLVDTFDRHISTRTINLTIYIGMLFKDFKWRNPMYTLIKQNINLKMDHLRNRVLDGLYLNHL